MAELYEPINQVRKTLKVNWYRTPIDREKLRILTKRSDLRGFVQSVGYLVLIACTGAATYLLFLNQIWVGMAVALFFHGTIFTFIPGLVTHEFSHGTVFKTRWLNGFFLRLYSLLGWTHYVQYKMSHTFHHLYTLHPQGDREVLLPTYPSLKITKLVQIFSFNFQRLILVLRTTCKLAFTGKFWNEWSEAIFPPEQKVARKKAIVFARCILVFHAGVIAVSIIFKLWMLPVVVSLPMFIANWWGYFIGITMHTGMKDNVPDFRLCTRTINLDPFSRFIYWHMNYHLEHHMFAAVPCYNLKKLQKEIAWDLPKPRSLVEAWREMRMVYRRQKVEPGYQFDTPLPKSKTDSKTGEDPLAGAIGELAPDTLD